MCAYLVAGAVADQAVPVAAQLAPRLKHNMARCRVLIALTLALMALHSVSAFSVSPMTKIDFGNVMKRLLTGMERLYDTATRTRNTRSAEAGREADLSDAFVRQGTTIRHRLKPEAFSLVVRAEKCSPVTMPPASSPSTPAKPRVELLALSAMLISDEQGMTMRRQNGGGF